jgi:ABC-type nitrate/sulfonate/bicarbonate transport system permease component
MLVVALPFLEKPVLQLGAVSYCVPIVAIGPVLVILFSGLTPRTILAGLSVFFITLVGSLAGLRSVGRPLLDSIHAFGGGAFAQLTKARWRAALPNLFAALRVAAPSAILGSIVGEFLGAENGLGVVLINSQQGMNFPRTWAVALFTTALAGTAYFALGLVGHWATPWARETHANLAGETAERGAEQAKWRRVPILLRVLGSALGSALIVIGAWILILKISQVSTFIGKGPWDVWAYLSDPDAGADNRSALLSESGISLRDAFLGLVSGTAAALVVASVFNILPSLRHIFMGPATALQSVPLVAMTPLIVLIFGRSLLAIAVIGGIITFFPTLVNLTLALDRTPRDAIDLMRVFGASRFDTLRKVQIPNALPALFASLRVASPLAITGAMLAEWLATGSGLGYSISSDVAVSDYSGLWTRVAVVTLYSLLLYNGIRICERLLMRRMLGTRT